MAEITKQQEDQPLKFTLTHYRKAGTTHEAFMKSIVEVHLPKAIPLFKKHGITGYALVSFSYDWKIGQLIILTLYV
jgi:hypothetical protein